MSARRLTGYVTAFAAALAMAVLAGGSAQAGVPLNPCNRFWAGSVTATTNNVNYPDEFAAYWGSNWPLGLPPGAVLVLHGQFPHARYMSFQTYNYNQPPPSQGPNDSLYDAQIVPDPGSTNPFVAGNPRDLPNRSYTIYIVSGTPPANPADRPANTLYTGRATGLGTTLVYRVYLADQGETVDGGVGEPQAELQFADGSVVNTGPGVCQDLSVESLGAGSHGLMNVVQYAALRTETKVNGVVVNVPPPVTHPSVNPPRFERWFNYRYSVVGYFDQTYPGFSFGSLQPPTYGQGRYFFQMYPEFSNPLADRSTFPATATGGPLSNKDGYAMIAFGDRGFGQLMVIHGRAPTVPHTYEGQDVMGTGQVRYWSFCQNEFQSGRYVSCVFDEQVPIAPDGTYTIVTGLPSDRPSNATTACGVAWLDWPVRGDGAPDYVEGGDPNGIPGTLLPADKGGRREMGFIGYRQILPDPTFQGGIGNVTTPGTAASVLGDYMPTAEYVSKAYFESLGCGSSSASNRAR